MNIPKYFILKNISIIFLAFETTTLTSVSACNKSKNIFNNTTYVSNYC